MRLSRLRLPRLRTAVPAVILAAALSASVACAEDKAPASQAPAEKPASTPKAGAAQKPTPPTFVLPAIGTAPKLDAAGYDALLKNHGSDVLVVNYWATFCGPCVEEIPYFIKVAGEHKPETVRFVGLSLDMENMVDTKVVPFLKDKKVTYPNYLLVVDPNEFISKVHEEWQGDLPATFIYDRQGTKLAAHLGPLTEEELRTAVAEAVKKVGASRAKAEAATPKAADSPAK